MTPAALAVLCDVLVLTLALFAVDLSLRRFRFHARLARFVLILATLMILKDLESPVAYTWLKPVMEVLAPSVALRVVALVGVAGLLAWASGSQRLGRWLQSGALAVSPFFLFNLALVIGYVAKGDSAYAELPRHQTQSPRPGPRVVWILFDCLDYHYAFEERPSGVQMPALDRFRGESVDFTESLAPGDRTEISIPGLLTGQQYLDSKASIPNDLDLTTMEGRHISLRHQRTVFADAEDLGARTAMVGIHLPYGRILGDQVSYCEWWQWPNQFASDESFFDRSVHAFAFAPSKPFTTWRSGTRQIRNHVAEMKIARELVADSRYRLEFLHLLPPHPQGMYDAPTGQLTLDNTLKNDWYFHNLALADASFRDLRHQMELAGTWDKTLVIVTADHSWWGASQFGHKVYPRIPLMVHFPGANSRLVVPQRINTIFTRDLVLGYLKGTITTPTGLANWATAWIKAHPKVPLTDNPPSLPKNAPR